MTGQLQLALQASQALVQQSSMLHDGDVRLALHGMATAVDAVIHHLLLLQPATLRARSSAEGENGMMEHQVEGDMFLGTGADEGLFLPWS